MSYKELVLLAPCHGLEDFPLYHTGDDAASLLACWTALWHPVLLDGADRLPHVQRCDYPPDKLQDALLLLPVPCESEMDADLPEAAQQQGANLIRGLSCREEILKRALRPLGDAASRVDPNLAKDFLAFGFAFLQVQLLTQQMRYASSIDETRIERTIKDAAAAAMAKEADLCREKLTSCHDALADERSQYYPVDVYLLDLTMLAPVASTLGTELEAQLLLDLPQNFLASGETIERLAESNPRALHLLKSSLQENRVGLAGGEHAELPLPLMSLESATRQFELGREDYRRHLDYTPTTFGRRRHGLYPSLADAIRLAKFASALHFKFDEGQCPESSQCKTNWLHGDEVLDTYARSPLDASSHDTFLNLPSQLSDTMDTDHVATRMFLHWPGHVAPWYDDLRRCHRYGTALGRFVTLQEYFSETADSGTRDEFSPDDYRYHFLQQSVAAGQVDPISRWGHYWRHSALAAMTRGTAALASLLTTQAFPDLSNEEQSIDAFESDAGGLDSLENKNMAALAAVGGVLCDPYAHVVTLLNPYSFSRRLLVFSETAGAGENVYASGREPTGDYATLVDVPAMGFAKVQFDATARALPGPDLAEDLTLRNEFFQATIDQETGALRSLKDYKSRSTLLSQQLGLRITLPKTGQPWIDRQAPILYSTMVGDVVEITRNGKIRAEITSRGRMLAPNEEEVGQFVQRYQITRGSRVLVLEMEITTKPELLLNDPWDSYYACRFAFGDESAVLRAGARMQTHDVARTRFEAPLSVEMDCGAHRVTVLSGGIPFHRRATAAQLDTILSVQGETATKFRLGIGIDLPSATRSALDFLGSDVDTTMKGSTQSSSGWLFHVDARNVVVSWWQSVDGGKRLRLRLVETDGRKSTARLSCFKKIAAAHFSNIDGEAMAELEVVDGVAQVPIKPHQYVEVVLTL